MRSTVSIAIILTLLVLILVLAASFVFLVQGRQTLAGQRDGLRTDVGDLQGELSETDLALQSINGTRNAMETSLATAEAAAVMLEGQLVDSQQQVDDQATQVSTLTSELVAATATVQALESVVAAAGDRLPEVVFLEPEADTAVMVNEEFQIVFAAADAAGITAVNLTIDGETIENFEVADETLFTWSTTWTPEAVGEVELGLVAVNTNGRASEPALMTLIVTPEIAPDNEGPLESVDPNAALRGEIEQNVTNIRGLTPTTAVTTTLISGDELQQRVETDLFADFSEEEAQQDYLVLRSFDMLPADFPLYTFLQDLYSEQIAGFYDPETNEFVVVSDDDTLDPLEQWTHAHEFVHALQDQHFGLEQIDDQTLDADASAALLALIEGEAMLVQWLYVTEGYLDIEDLFGLQETQDTTVLSSAPPILANSLLFPYDTGLTFAQTLFLQDDFAGIADAWDAPPASTEQIIHPDRYLAGDEPQLVPLPPLTSTLGTGWSRVDEDVFGEFMLREYLGQQLSAAEVDRAATGWGGDRYALYLQEDSAEIVMLLRLVWDSDEDALEFAAIYPDYLSALFGTSQQAQGDDGACWQGPEDIICLFATRRETLIIRAPDMDLIEEINTQFD